MPTKSIAEKLLIKPGARLWISDAAHQPRIEPLPEGVTLVGGPGEATIGLLFVDSADTARDLLAVHQDHLALLGILWVAYPKGGRADINRDSLWPLLTEYGLRPVSQVAVDAIWSALRFRPLKEGEAQFAPGQ